MIKIIQFIYSINTGGAETLVKNYMINFDKKKIDATLVCLSHSKGSPYEKDLTDAGVDTIYIDDYLPFKGCTNFFAKAARHLCRYFIVRRVVKNIDPDIFHYHMIVGKYVKHSRIKKDVPIFRTVHSEAEKVWFSGKPGQRSDFLATRWLIRKRAMRLIVLRADIKNKVDKIFGVDNSIVLNNGIDVSKYGEMVDVKKKRSRIGIPENAFVIGHIGRFSEAKNHDFLVDVFIKIKKTKKEAFLFMVGDGDDKEKIRRKLLDHGFCKNDFLILSNRGDIPELLAIMDIFVFPSLYEGLPLSLVEAQETKLPCFVSDAVPGHTTTSNLVTRLSLEDGAEKWAEVINDYKKPEKIVINDEDWNIKKVTKQLEKIYEGALEEKKNGKK